MKEHLYHDPYGKVIGIKVREKTPQGKKIWWKKPLEKVGMPYNVHKLGGKRIVFILEGEKCCDLFEQFTGWTATCSPNGSTVDSNTISYIKMQKVERCVIIPDNDKPGEEYAKTWASELLKAEIPCKIVKLKSLWPGEDFEQWIGERRGTLPMLKGHIKHAPLIQMPSQKLMRMDTVEPVAVDWVWDSKIPKGFMSLMFGMPGTMKSYVSIAMAVGLSTGKGLPMQKECDPVRTLFLLGEDSARGVLINRLNKFPDVNLSNIYAYDDPLVFDEGNLHEINKMVKQNGIGMIVVDPLNAFFGNVDTHKDSVVREVLSELLLTCRENNTALLAISHMNKSQITENIYRVSGTSGIPALSRSIFLVGKITEDLNGKPYDRFIMVHVKNNLSRMTPSLEFKVDKEGNFRWVEQTKYGDKDIYKQL